MFGLFKKKPAAAEERYLVFKTKTKKYRKLLEEIKFRTASNTPTVLLFFTKQTGQEMEKLLQGLSIDFTSEGTGSTSPLYLYSVDYALKHPMKKEAEIILAEEDMIRSKQQQLSERLVDHSTLTIYSSLDSPLFNEFGGDRIVALMEKMGIQENEHLEHSFIKASIINAQEKMEKRKQY